MGQSMGRSAVILGGCAIAIMMLGCGSSSAPGSSGGTGSPGSAASSSLAGVGNPCSLLTSAQLTTLGLDPTNGTPAPPVTAPDSPQFVGCHWHLANDQILGGDVVVSTPSGSAGLDYITLYVGTIETTANTSSVPVGTDGKLITYEVFPGGGGIGKTIVFKKGSLSAYVSESGANADANALQTVATQLASALP